MDIPLMECMDKDTLLKLHQQVSDFLNCQKKSKSKMMCRKNVATS